jgi:hypothetical protein
VAHVVAYERRAVIVLRVVRRRVLVGTCRARVWARRAVFPAPLRGADGFTLTSVLPTAAGPDGVVTRRTLR